jgi:hypothetical protein
MMKFWFLAAAPLISGWLTVAQAQNWIESQSSKAGIETHERYRNKLDGDHYNDSSYAGNKSISALATQGNNLVLPVVLKLSFRIHAGM